MAGPFEISTASNVVTLDVQKQASVTFTVKNGMRRNITGIARIASTPDTAEQWFNIDKPTRDFSIEATHQYEVEIKAPEDAEAGTVTFRLVIADEFSGEEHFTEGPDVQFTIPQKSAKPPKSPWGIIALIVIILVVIGGVALLVLTRPAGSPVIVADEDGQAIYSAPYNEAAEQATAEAGKEYAVLGVLEGDPNWYLVELPDNEVGWINIESADLELNGDQNAITPMPGPTLTATSTMEPTATATGTRTPLDPLAFDNRTLKAQEAASVWNIGNVELGEKIDNISEGEDLVLLSGPTTGVVDQGSSTEGEWYLVRRTNTSVPLGWVEGRFLEFTPLIHEMIYDGPQYVGLLRARLSTNSEAIKFVQTRLQKLGYSTGTIDGVFGQNTRSAVIEFQTQNGLQADGIVGPDTWSMLVNIEVK